MLTITGSLLDRVKEIRFPGGASVAYGSWTVSDDGAQIDVKAPEGIVDGKLTLVQNSNIAVDTESISTRKMGNVIWTGNIDFGGWSNYLQIASECNDDVWDTFSKEIKGPGTLTLHFDEDASSTYWQIATVYRSDWDTQFEGATSKSTNSKPAHPPCKCVSPKPTIRCFKAQAGYSRAATSPSPR